MSRKLLKRKNNEPQPGDSYMVRNSDTVCINCRGCSQFPDTGSPMCIICICEAISREGAADRIKLLAGRDIEIAGNAAEMFCDLARISRPAVLLPTGKKCQRCSRSPERVLDAAWADFPDPNFPAACSRLYSDNRDGPECASCMQRTYAALISAESEMKKIREKAARLSDRGSRQ